MAKGDIKSFHDILPYYRGTINFDSDQLAFALLSDTYASISQGASSPTLGSFTECSAGGNYSAGGVNLTLDNTETGGVHTIKLDTGVFVSGTITIDLDASNPTDARCGLFYSKTASDAAFAVVDLTDDGSTAVDLVGRDLEYTPDDSGTPGRITTFTVAT